MSSRGVASQSYSAAPTAPEVHHDGVPIGIDKLEVNIPVSREIEPHNGGGVTAYMVRGADSRRLYVSCNPSRILMPMSGQLCPVSRLGDALGALLDLLPYGRFELGIDALWQAEITRLDVARDFHGVWHLTQILDGLRRLPPPRGMTVTAYDNGGIGSRWNGLTFGKGSRVLIYDRHQRRPRFSTSGEARFEVLARREWLLPHGIVRVGDLTKARAESVLMRMWAQVGAGTTILREQDWIDRVLSRSGWSPAVAGRFLFDSFCLIRERPLRGSAAHIRNFRSRLADMGVGVELDDVVSVRLDIQSGTEVVVPLAAGTALPSNAGRR